MLGISPDKPATQANFRSKEKLPFTLLADPERKAVEAFGAVKPAGGVQRSTFVIGEDGVIRAVFANVKAAGHAREVLDTL